MTYNSARPTLFQNTTGQIVENSVKFSKFQWNNKDAFVCHFQRPRIVSKEGETFVKDLVTQGIDTLSEKAINRGLPPNIVHNVSNVVREGAHKGVELAGEQIEKFTSRPSNKRDQTIQPQLPSKKVKYNLQNIEES